MPLINSTLYTERIGDFVTGSENALGFAANYFLSLPSLVAQGDYFAIMISLIIGYLLILILYKIRGLFLIVLKKTIALAVTVLALLLVYSKFMNSPYTEGFSVRTIVIGIIGIGIAVLGTIISFYSLFKNTKNAILAERKVKKAPAEETLQKEPEINLNQLKDFKTFFSLDSLKNDKSLLSVLTFLVVAEFGVFSSVTISAPNVKMGIIIFSIFIVLSFVFIKQSYRNYKKGLIHIFVTFALGTVLAVVLGHYWADISFSVLLSVEIFKTAALVALISGMALSLFAGSRT